MFNCRKYFRKAKSLIMKVYNVCLNEEQEKKNILNLLKQVVPDI